MQVVPVLATGIHWPRFLSMAKEVLGRSISKGLDARSESVEGVRGLLAILTEMVSPGLAFGEVHAHLLQHASFGFACLGHADEFYEIMERTGLPVASVSTDRGKRFGIVSGTLAEWRAAVIEGCSQRASAELRAFMDQCCLHLEAAGLGQLWSAYQKTTLPDNTFRLETR